MPYFYQNINSDNSEYGDKTGTEEAASRNRRHKLLQRAVMKWLLEQDPPSGMATEVSTRISRYRADIAAFWSETKNNPRRKHGPKRILKPTRTMIIECRSEWQDCWPDCARSRNLVEELRQEKEKREELQKKIRNQEPNLRCGDVLFSEYAEWRYEETANPEYHRLQEKIENLEAALLKGTKFEKIRRSEMADQLLLAVPTGLVQPPDMADGWGLLWINEDLKAEIVKTPETRECHVENRLHLIQNVAAAGTEKELFAAGVRPPAKKHKHASLVQPPRGHRQPKNFRLSSEPES